MSHVTNVHENSGNSQCMQYSDKNEHKKGKKNITRTYKDKKLSYRRGTARCVVSIEILPIATQQCRNYLYDKS